MTPPRLNFQTWFADFQLKVSKEMTFQGQSVISAVWGVVPTPTSRELANLPAWMRLRLFRRNTNQRPRSPRLPVGGSDRGTDTRGS